MIPLFSEFEKIAVRPHTIEQPSLQKRCCSYSDYQNKPWRQKYIYIRARAKPSLIWILWSSVIYSRGEALFYMRLTRQYPYTLTEGSIRELKSVIWATEWRSILQENPEWKIRFGPEPIFFSWKIYRSWKKMFAPFAYTLNQHNARISRKDPI